MEKYKIITENVYDHYHNVITRAGLETALKFPEYIGNKQNMDSVTFLRMANNGVKILRSKDRKLYDSLLGAIFGMGISLHFPNKKILLAEPENNSYDLTVLMIGKNDKIKFKTTDTNWFLKETIFKLELTELRDVSDNELTKLCLNKLGNRHDYKGRVLLISVDTSGKLNLENFAKILKKNNNNFENVWLIARTSLNENRYLLAELLKHPLLKEEFVINLNFLKIKDEIKCIANYEK